MPFWKKIDKGGKKKPPKPAVPRTAQQSIPMTSTISWRNRRIRLRFSRNGAVF